MANNQIVCLIDANTNVVLNSIIVDVDTYVPGPGTYLGVAGGSHGDTYDSLHMTYTPPPPVYPPLANQQSALLNDAWNHMEKLLENSSANVTIANTAYPFGCDSESRENIMGINTAIAIGLPVPDPRPWTPKGFIEPVQCSHSDLAAIGAALLAKKDAFMNAYFVHKAAIKEQSNQAILAAYDVTTGYDGL